MKRRTWEARARVRYAGLILWLWGVPACGDDGAPADSELPRGGRDAQVSPPRDAGSGEADAGGDAEVPDGGDDAGAPSPSVRQCQIEAPELTLEIDDKGFNPWDLKRFGQTFHLVYQATACGPRDVGLQGLRWLSFRSTGAFGEPEDLVNMGEECTSTRSPVLGATEEGEPVVYYGAANTGALELYRLDLDKREPQRLTTDDENDGDDEDLLAWAPLGERGVLAYVNNLRVFPDPAYGQLVTREDDGPERSLIERSAQHHFRSLALAGFDAAGGALAWVVTTPSAAIQLQLLDGMGAAKGAPLLLSQAASSATNVALTTYRGIGTREMGAAVFSETPLGTTSQQIAFRSFEPDGTLGPLVRLTHGDRDARNVGIAPFADGYVVAFRVLSGSGRPNPVVQLAFVNRQGGKTSGGERILTDASGSGGDIKVLTASDGRLVVAFTDRTDEGVFLRVLRANCL